MERMWRFLRLALAPFPRVPVWIQTVGALAAVVLPFFGLAVPKIELTLPWAIAASLGVVVVLTLRAGAIQRGQLDDHETVARPVVAFDEPRADPAVPMVVGGRTQPWVFGRVFNSHFRPGEGVVAERAIPRLRYSDADTDAWLAGPLDGRWRDAPSVIQGSPLQTHATTRPIPLDANGTRYEFDLVTRDKDQRLHGIDAAQQAYELRAGRIRVHVEIHGNNFEPISASFLIEDSGSGLPAVTWDG